MVLVQFLANIGGGEVCELADQIDGHLPGLYRTLILQRTSQHRFIHRVEFAYLGDNQKSNRKRIE